MKPSKLLSIMVVALIFAMSVCAKDFIPVAPRSAQLIKHEHSAQGAQESDTYLYQCTLDKKQIFKHYHEQFLFDGWKAQAHPLSDADTPVIVFAKAGINMATVTVVPLDKGVFSCEVRISQWNKISVFLGKTFKPARQLEFVPTYTSATEFEYNTGFPPMIGIGYLTSDDPEIIGNFYIEQMPHFGWGTPKVQSYAGVYTFSEWISIVDPFTKAVPMLQAVGFADLVPPLAVRGKTMTFTQGKKNCTITVYQFKGIVDRSINENSIFDMSAMGKYGETVICIYYFYDEKK